MESNGITFALIAQSTLFAGVLWALIMLIRRGRNYEQQLKQSRLMIDRLQSMIAVIPGGYCLFTQQGLLREAVRLTALLEVEKITHSEDIIRALKNAPDFVDAFRQLQLAGQDFSVSSRTAQSGKPVQIEGRRFRAGRDGLIIDLLWFYENPVVQLAEKRLLDLNEQRTINEQSRQSLLDAFPYPVWMRGEDLNLLYSNVAYAQALDTSPEEVLKGQIELTSQTTKGGSGRALATRALTLSKPQSGRRHVIMKGVRHLLEITEIPYRAAPSAGPALLGFAIDVTAEEEKENALQRHLSAEHEVLENLGSPIAMYGPDTRLEFYNRAYQRLWSAEEQFLNSKPTFGEILEDLRARRRAPEQADFQRYKKERVALFTSLLEPREDLMHLPDGTTLRILASPHPLGGLLFVHEDVTDKLALESSYNTLIAVQRETLDNLAEGIAVFGPDGKVRLFNPAFARIWKLPTEFLQHNPHIAELLEHMKGLFNYGQNWSIFKNEMVEYTLDRNPRCGRIERADQSIIEYNVVPLPDGAVLNSYLDVTDSVKVEQALRASNAALATADRLKSEFVANVSYQLRTPLNTIMGFAEILTNQYFGSLNERQLEYSRTIMEASKKLLLLINDVLDLATIEAGRMTLSPSDVRVAGLLNAVKDMSLEWARQQSLEIVIDCPPTCGSFYADDQRMKQILFNLVSNAIKYTPAGGRITLMARRAPDSLTLSVIDSGIGIPEQDRERVFGKFERANAQARQSGAGLGLSLVKNLVDLHHGTIEVASESGKGTRVSCSFPLHPPVEVRTSAANAS